MKSRIVNIFISLALYFFRRPSVSIIWLFSYISTGMLFAYAFCNITPIIHLFIDSIHYQNLFAFYPTESIGNYTNIAQKIHLYSFLPSETHMGPLGLKEKLTYSEQLYFLSLLEVVYENFLSFGEIYYFLVHIDTYNQFFNFNIFYELFFGMFLDNDFGPENVHWPEYILGNFSITYVDIFSSFISHLNSTKQGFTFTEWCEAHFLHFLTIEFFFINFMSYFLKQKIFIFFLITSLLLIIMFWNLTRLCKASNLIYALLYFLSFATLSAFILIFWGAVYIGLCVLLIYAAAIPILALYIIMLINVDLVQRLFFSEYFESAKKYSEKKFYFIIAFAVFAISCFYKLITNFFYGSGILTNELETNINYLLLVKRYINCSKIFYGVDNIYNLPLSFYAADIDKVASAGFVASYNELLTLVLLLLIAIIIVIAISRPQTFLQLSPRWYPTLNLKKLNLFLLFNYTINFGELLQFVRFKIAFKGRNLRLFRFLYIKFFGIPFQTFKSIGELFPEERISHVSEIYSELYHPRRSIYPSILQSPGFFTKSNWAANCLEDDYDDFIQQFARAEFDFEEVDSYFYNSLDFSTIANQLYYNQQTMAYFKKNSNSLEENITSA